VIFDILQELGAPITKETAEAVYVGMATDTGCFCYSNTSAHTLRTAAFCKEAGADTETWNRILFLTRTAARLQVEAYLTNHTEFFLNGKIALCTLPEAVVSAFHPQEDDLDGIAGFPRDIEGVDVGIMIRDVADGVKISLRTFAPWDASAICAYLGGGGHSAAAGATVKGTIEDARAAVLEALRKYGAEV
jgi:phosphoesterase RecJ-like protein